MIMKGVVAAPLIALGLSAAVYLRGEGTPRADLAAETSAVAADVRSPSTGAQAVPFAGAATPTTPTVPTGRMLPARLLDCTLGRITNFDRFHDQPPSEYRYDGKHAFKLFLPSIPVRTTPPPEATQPAEPVDPNTRIVADPDGIASEIVGVPFDRVVDIWPSRVEMLTKINSTVSNVIVVAQVNLEKTRATMFMAKANDAVTYDMGSLYYGQCNVSSGGRLGSAR